MKIHFLKTEWSDMIVLQDGKNFALIDTGFLEQYEQLRDYLLDLGCTGISFILNTHFHRDHYGSIPRLVEDFKVEKVYLKEYSALDCTTAWGTPADDAYRTSEMKNFENMKKLVSEKSCYVPVEGVKSVYFGDTELKLFCTENVIRKIYEDESNPETFHKICFSENTNSLCVFFKTNGKNVFLGGDMNDLSQPHPLADRMVFQAANQINEKIDLYKVPHHATWHTGLPETLEIFKPAYAVITNGEEYVSNQSDALKNLKTANPDIRIGFTKEKTIVVDLES